MRKYYQGTILTMGAIFHLLFHHKGHYETQRKIVFALLCDAWCPLYPCRAYMIKIMLVKEWNSVTTPSIEEV